MAEKVTKAGINMFQLNINNDSIAVKKQAMAKFKKNSIGVKISIIRKIIPAKTKNCQKTIITSY